MFIPILKILLLVVDFQVKISKGFEQKLASFGLKTPFKVQMVRQKSSLRAIGKPNGHRKAGPSWARLGQAGPSWAKLSQAGPSKADQS